MEVRIINVSPQGLAVETLERLPFLAGGCLRFRVGDVAMEWTGEMKWCRLARIEPIYEESRPVFSAGFHVALSEGSVEEKLMGALHTTQLLDGASSFGDQALQESSR